MSDLINITKNIQRHLGVQADGIFGPISAAAAWKALNRIEGGSQEEDGTAKTPSTPSSPSEEWKAGLDARTISNIETLDPKVRGNFAQFARLAKATAATLGCDYVMISGNRTWEEQDALFTKRPKVTNAKGGQSNHNFKVAGDFGVFRGKADLDGSDATMAAKVHRACSVHARACGLEWGGSWISFTDLPHYEYATGLSMAEKRNVFKVRGSIV